MSLTWTPAADGDPTFTPAGTISSDRVTVGGETLTDVLDDLGPGGVTDHGDLTGRDDPDQHPAEAITAPEAAGAFRAATVVEAFEGVANAIGGADVLRADIAATLPYVVAVLGDDVAGQLVNAGGLDLYTLAMLAREAGTLRLTQDLAATDAVTPGPLVWAECGLGIDGYDALDPERGWWRCVTLPPAPTSTLKVRTLTRPITGSVAAVEYQEHWSIPADGTVGSIDALEVAHEWTTGNLRSFLEWADTFGEPEIGQYQAPGIPLGAWVREQIDFDLATGVIAFRAAGGVGSDHTDPDDDTRWTTLRTVTHGPTSIGDWSGAVEQWMGRGGGRFDIASLQVWVDGVLVVDPAIDEAADGATAIPDRVLESAPGVPAVWEAQESAVIGVPDSTGGGAVASVNGQTGAVTLGAGDVGAAPTTRTISTGTGLTGGGDLSADRTLAIDAATLARIGVTVDTTADVGPRTSTTATADGALEFAAAANTTYRIDAYLIFQGDGGADLKVGFTAPAGTMHLTIEGPLTTVASNQDYDRFLTLAASAATAVVGIAGASTPIAVRITGVIHTTAAGTVALIWAPNAAGAGTGVTRLARSQLYYRTA